MKSFILKGLNNTLGKAVRMLQSFKLDERVVHTNSALKVTLEVHNRAVIQSVDYAVNNMSNAIVCMDRIELWNYCLSKVQDSSPTFFEFGVHKGESINYINARHNFSSVYGFDSFYGLEEDWSGYSVPKGTFNLQGQLPRVTEGIQLVPGWFEETLPEFLVANPQIQSVSLLHMDADTYTPTSYVLNSLHELIISGTVIIFDEYFGYNNWQSHEFKAFQEFVKKFEVSYSYIAYSDMQAAVQIN